MKKSIILLVLAVLALLFTTAVPVYADHGHFGGHVHHSFVGRGHDRFIFRGGVWIGPGWDPWWDTYPYYSPYYPVPPVVIQQQPQVYVQPSQQQDQKYWYFCKNTQTYYPYVKQCADGWEKVVPPSSPPDEGTGGVSP